MANTYQLISSNVLSSSAPSITFSAIPAIYKDLIIKYSAKGDNEGGINGTLKIEFNGDTDVSFYDTLMIIGNGSGGAPTAGINNEKILIQMSGQTADGFGTGEIYIPSYLASFGVSESNTSAAAMMVTAGLYANSVAISSITIKQNSGTNFISGSSFYLYGVKNS